MELKDAKSIGDYLGQSFQCSCGRTHSTKLQRVEVEPRALEKLPGFLREQGFSRVFLVADQNTWAAAGEEIQALLTRDGLTSACKVFQCPDLVPDEGTLGSLLMAIPVDTQVVLAVGTGTINDCCKFLSFRLGLPYVTAATAPSMDGFASVGAALITENLKTTYDAHVPLAIFADLEVLCGAPMEMITAGVGDILGKYTCLCDWYLSHILWDEYYCPGVEEMVRRSIRQVRENLAGVPRRDPKAIQSITEALILTGIAMSFVGNSRPASGCEHHLSHYWEMQFLFLGKRPVLHGTKVGTAEVVALRLYERILEREPDFDHAKLAAQSWDPDAWERGMERLFGPAAPGVIALEQRAKKNDPVSQEARIAVLKERWPRVREAIRQLLPPSSEIAGMLKGLGAPASPLAVGVERQMVSDAIVAAKEVRNRYTLLQLLWDLGVSWEAAEEVAGSFEE